MNTYLKTSQIGEMVNISDTIDMSMNFVTNSNDFLSVSDVFQRIKILLENNFENVKIKGEISGLKIATSGHAYFTLKDTNAIIAATCWKYNLNKIKFKLEDGLDVIVTGKITAYGNSSKYQISVNEIKPTGVGAFIKILEERRKKLASEGLFNKEHKLKIPFLPKIIGIITSPSGAVIRDIIHRIEDRFPSKLFIWPVSVQGESSAQEVVNAINGFNKQEIALRPDVIIIARGGGSIEDLWSFNEEIVIRAAYNSTIPIISAIGHETDYTLLDLVSDLRAPTPTAAAEFAVPVLKDLKYRIHSIINYYNSKILKVFSISELLLTHNTAKLCRTMTHIENYIQLIDEMECKIKSLIISMLKQKKMELKYPSIDGTTLHKIVQYKQLQLQNNYDRLSKLQNIIIDKCESKLQHNKSLLEVLDHKNIIKMGYTIIKDRNGNYITSKSDIITHNEFYITFHDGELYVNREHHNQDFENC